MNFYEIYKFCYMVAMETCISVPMVFYRAGFIKAMLIKIELGMHFLHINIHKVWCFQQIGENIGQNVIKQHIWYVHSAT